MVEAETEEHVVRQVHAGFVHKRFCHDALLKLTL